MRECVQAINLAGLRCDQIVHEPRFGPWFGSVFVRGYLGLTCRQGYLGLKLGPGMWALIYLGLLNRGAGLKAMVPTMNIN